MDLQNTHNPHLLRVKDNKLIESYDNWYSNLQGVIKDIHFPYAIIKGEMLSIMAYGDKGYRKSNDIDILIPKQYINELYNILQKNGFTHRLYDKDGKLRNVTREEKIMFANSHQVTPYFKDMDDLKDTLKLDINFDIFWGEYRGKRIDMNDFLSDTIEISEYGYPIKALPLLKSFVSVCLHHYKEMNSIYKFRSKNTISTPMFQDIYCLYINGIKDNIAKLYEYSQQNEIIEFVYYMLYYTSQVFFDLDLTRDAKLFESEKGKELLEYYGLNEKEKRKWSIGFHERLDANDLYDYIMSEASEKDIEKTNIVYSIYRRL